MLNPERAFSLILISKAMGFAADTGKIVKLGKFCSTVGVWGKDMVGSDNVEKSKETGSMVWDYVEKKKK